MNGNYAEKAANWWSEMIRVSYPNTRITELVSFEKLLTKKIQSQISYRGTLSLSSYSKLNTILEDVAYQSMLPVDIPKGYEMKIMINNISVYNSDGLLVSTL